MTNNLNELIRQTELKKKQMELSRQFERNMQFLAGAAPDLHKQFSHYQPKGLQLAFRDDGELDLVKLASGDYVYQGSLESLHEKAVDDFFKTPKHYHVQYEPKEDRLAEHEPYIVHTNAAIRRLNHASPKTGKPRDLTTIKLLVVAGVGVGSHLSKLLQRSDIRNLFIIEPDEDLFYASLHTVDWPAVAEYFARDGYSLNLQVGQSPENAIGVLQRHLNGIGPYNAVTIYLFDLLQTQKVSESTRHLLQQLSRSLTVQGYFDDERVGLAHTINNIRNRTPALTNHARLSGVREPLPVFVVGNGPSLDKAHDFLLANQHKAVVISCGTTLGSLERMGIKPDFHIEQERPREISEWLSAATSAEFRKTIHLVGLNTVHPDTFNLFERKAMFMKPNDLGSTYSQKLVKKGKHIIQLPYCNPTVTNAGLSLAVALGFSEIYLIGVDYGSPSKDRHHSKHAPHYRIKREYNEKVITPNALQSGSEVEGNFGGTVETTRTLNLSRLSAEDLISQYPEFSYFNTSEGARIKGANPIRYEEIELSELPNAKESLVQTLFDKQFSVEPFDTNRLAHRIEADFKPVGKALTAIITLLDKPVETVDDASERVDRIQRYLTDLPRQSIEEKSGYMLIRGSINMFNMLLQSALNREMETGQALEVFDFISGEYKAYLYNALEQLRSQLLENDQRRGNIAEVMDK